MKRPSVSIRFSTQINTVRFSLLTTTTCICSAIEILQSLLKNLLNGSQNKKMAAEKWKVGQQTQEKKMGIFRIRTREKLVRSAFKNKVQLTWSKIWWDIELTSFEKILNMKECQMNLIKKEKILSI